MKVLHIIKSASYNSDGRLQKWVSKLRTSNVFSDVVIVEDSNKDEIEENNDTKIIRMALKSRRYFSKRKGYLFKVPEYYFLTKNILTKNRYDLILFHDVQQYLNLFWLLAFHKDRDYKIIWDLHELPHDFLMKFRLSRSVLRFLISNVDAVVYTNNERRDYILDKVPGVIEKQFFILNNYPDKNFLTKGNDTINVEGFSFDKPYFLWLGAGIGTRNFDSFLKAYNSFKNEFNLVVIGKIDPFFYKEITTLKKEKVLYNDFVDQKEIKKFIDNSYLSVVLYKSNSANNLLCEPNRLYQLLGRHVPVVVGNNPTMANLVNELNVGEVLSDDGNNVTELIRGIQNVIENYDEFKLNSSKINFEMLFSWEEQVDKIINFIKV